MDALVCTASSAQRVRKRRVALRAQGLRPVQIWVPDTRAPGFAEEYARQAAIADAANRNDPELMDFPDAAAADLAEGLDSLESRERERSAATSSPSRFRASTARRVPRW